MSTGINAHVFTDPNAKTREYYWVRVLDDPKYGISGFVYVSNLKTGRTYNVAPKSIEFVSSMHSNIYADVSVNGVDGVLEVQLWYTGSYNYASFTITNKNDPSEILDFSPAIRCEVSGYIRTVGKLVA